MDIHKIKEEEWMPKRYKLGYNWSSFSWIFLFTASYFLLVALIEIDYQYGFDYLMSLILTLVFVVCKAITIRKEKTELTEQGIRLGKNKLVSYDDIYYSSIAHSNSASVTIHCHNETGEVIARLKLEQNQEFPIVMSILASHNCLSKNPNTELIKAEFERFTRLLNEVNLERLMTLQLMDYDIYKKYTNKTPVQIFWGFVWSYSIKIGAICMAVSIIDGLILEGASILECLVMFFVNFAVIMVAAFPPLLYSYDSTLNIVRCYE